MKKLYEDIVSFTSLLEIETDDCRLEDFLYDRCELSWHVDSAVEEINEASDSQWTWEAGWRAAHAGVDHLTVVERYDQHDEELIERWVLFGSPVKLANDLKKLGEAND